MPRRFALVTMVALGAMVSFMAMGCGDDNNQAQQDAGQHDVNTQQEDAPAQHDVATSDVPVQTDGPLQSDTAVQVDAANTGGTVIVVQVAPQPTGTAFDAVKIASVVADWDPLTPSGDNPTIFVDKRVGGLGCYAKYYKFTTANDAGANIPVSNSANAGNVTVTGYTGGQFISGMDVDAGTPVFSAMPSTVTCTRSEIFSGDAGTGRYEYNCDTVPPPVTGFLTPGTDRLTINAAGGGNEIGAFSATNVEVAPFLNVTAPGALWGITHPAMHTDGGVTIPYKCGDNVDAGTPVPCNGVLGLQIQWTDTVTPMNELTPRDPTLEMGRIVCSKIGAGTSFTIPPDVWEAGFPAGNNWQTILTYLVNMSLTTKHGMSTLIGVGGGQIGITHKP